MKRAHLLEVRGKVQFQGGGLTTAFLGHASLSKSHWHYMLKAEITPSTAAGGPKLEEMRKKTTVEEAAKERARGEGAEVAIAAAAAAGDSVGPISAGIPAGGLAKDVFTLTCAK